MQTCKVDGVVNMNIFCNTSIQGLTLQCGKAPLNSIATLLSTSRCKLPVQSLWVSDLPVILLSEAAVPRVVSVDWVTCFETTQRAQRLLCQKLVPHLYSCLEQLRSRQ